MQDLARERGQSPGAFVREALRSVIRAAAQPTPAEKLREIRAAVGFTYPVGVIEDLLAKTDKPE